MASFGIGIAALVRHEIGSIDNGSVDSGTSAEIFCVPEDYTSRYFQYTPFQDEYTGTYTRVLYTRSGNIVNVKVQHVFVDPLYWSNNYAGQSFIGIDHRCFPPSELFVSCDGPCPEPSYSNNLRLYYLGEAPTYQPHLDSSSIVTYINENQGGYDSLLNVANQYPIQFETNGILFYGMYSTIGKSTSANTDNYNVISIVNWNYELNYITNATSDWQVPDHCKGAICSPY